MRIFLSTLCLALCAASSCHGFVELTKEFAYDVDKLSSDGKCEYGKYSVAPDGVPVDYEDECSEVTCGDDWVIRGKVCFDGNEEGMCFRDDPGNGKNYPWCCTKKRIDCDKVEFAFDDIDELNAEGKCERYGQSALPNTLVYDLKQCSMVKCVGSEKDGWLLTGGQCYKGDEAGMCFEDVEPTGEEFPNCCTKKVARCPDGNWTKKKEE